MCEFCVGPLHKVLSRFCNYVSEEERVDCFTSLCPCCHVDVSVLSLFLAVPLVGLWTLVCGISWSYSLAFLYKQNLYISNFK